MNNGFTRRFWNEDRDAELKRLWGEGYSGQQIAERLHAASRNAVIGRVHRLGLAGRCTSPKAAAKPRKKHPWRQKANAEVAYIRARVSPFRQDGLPLPEPGAEDKARVSFLDLEPQRHCRFPCWASEVPPVGEPAFCGATPISGLPYCEIHARKAFQLPQARQREPMPRVVKETEQVAA